MLVLPFPLFFLFFSLQNVFSSSNSKSSIITVWILPWLLQAKWIHFSISQITLCYNYLITGIKFIFIILHNYLKLPTSVSSHVFHDYRKHVCSFLHPQNFHNAFVCKVLESHLLNHCCAVPLHQSISLCPPLTHSSLSFPSFSSTPSPMPPLEVTLSSQTHIKMSSWKIFLKLSFRGAWVAQWS